VSESTFLKGPVGRAPVESLESLLLENQRLRIQLEKLEREQRFSQELVAGVLHDLRSPLNVIQVASQVVCDGSTREARRTRNAQLLAEAVASLDGLCQDFLDFSKLSAGKLKLREGHFALRKCVHSVMDGLRLLAEKKGIELHVHIQEGSPDYLLGDESRLKQILQNLVSNSIKFTHQGSVQVRLQTRLRDDICGLQVEIVDTGVGIQASKLATIFRAFEQTRGDLDADLGGSGLGLSIADKLVQLMGGRISVESVAGRGSRFSFEVHLEMPRAVVASPVKLLESRQIMILDESDETRAELEASCLCLGLHPVAVSDGVEAIERLEVAYQKGCAFPLAIFNLESSGGEALFLVEQVRPETRSQTRFLAFYPHSREPDWRACREIGMSGGYAGVVETSAIQSILVGLVEGGDGVFIHSEPGLREE